MLTTVDLDDNPTLMASEVGEIRTDRGLASKMMFLEWRLAQMLPQPLLGLSGMTAQYVRTWNAFVPGTLRSLCHAPRTPDPSPPQAGGGEQIRPCKSPVQNALTRKRPQPPRRLPYAARLRRKL